MDLRKDPLDPAVPAAAGQPGGYFPDYVVLYGVGPTKAHLVKDDGTGPAVVTLCGRPLHGADQKRTGEEVCRTCNRAARQLDRLFERKALRDALK